MRTMLVALLLAGAALAALPSTSAAVVTPVCVPPASGNGVCVGTIGNDPCVWAWLGPSFRSVCVDDESGDVVVCQNSTCTSVRDLIVPAIGPVDPVCVPPGTLNGVCVGFISGNPCVWAWLGPSFNAVCVDVAHRDILLCDNSGCTSILRFQTAAALPEVPLIGVPQLDQTTASMPPYISPLPALLWCNPDFAGVCASTSPTGACAGVNFGLQGASACADAEDGVRICTSARSVLWEGYCPTSIGDGLIRTD